MIQMRTRLNVADNSGAKRLMAILPLGGYVKMLGQDDNPYNQQEELERAKADGGDAADGEEVRVTGTDAGLVINGEAVATEAA